MTHAEIYDLTKTAIEVKVGLSPHIVDDIQGIGIILTKI